MEKNLGGAESLQGRSNSVSQVDGVSNTAPACQLYGSVEGGLRKGKWPLLALMSNTPASLSMPLVPFKLLPWCWSSEAGSLCRWVRVCSLRGTAWGFSTFLHWVNPHWILQPEVLQTYLPAPGTLGLWGQSAGVGLCLLIPEISLPNFYPPHLGETPSHSTSPPLLPVWMWFL